MQPCSIYNYYETNLIGEVNSFKKRLVEEKPSISVRYLLINADMVHQGRNIIRTNRNGLHSLHSDMLISHIKKKSRPKIDNRRLEPI